MNQQNRLRTSAVDFPAFSSFVETTTCDLKSGYEFYSRTKIDLVNQHPKSAAPRESRWSDAVGELR